jgi:hypothetical protein
MVVYFPFLVTRDVPASFSAGTGFSRTPPPLPTYPEVVPGPLECLTGRIRWREQGVLEQASENGKAQVTFVAATAMTLEQVIQWLGRESKMKDAMGSMSQRQAFQSGSIEVGHGSPIPGNNHNLLGPMQLRKGNMLTALPFDAGTSSSDACGRRGRFNGITVERMPRRDGSAAPALWATDQC